MPIPVFLLGFSVRCGTNYLGSLISHSSYMATVPPDISHGEFGLNRYYVDTQFDDYATLLLRSSFGIRRDITTGDLKRAFGDATISLFTSKYNINKPYIFFKDPYVYGAEQLHSYFPDSKIIILVRDGRDVISSYTKAASLIRRSYNFRRRVVMKFKSLTGWNFVAACRSFNVSVARLLETYKLLPAEKVLLMRYEDIVKDTRIQLKTLFEFLNVPLTESDLEKMIDTDVVGSSFYQSSGNAPKWGKVKKSVEFNSVGRWRSWNGLQRFVFNRLSKKSYRQLEMFVKQIHDTAK